MDGVLFVSSDCHEMAFKEVLEGIGIKDFPYASIAGMRTDDSFKKIFSERGINSKDYDLRKLVQDKSNKSLEFLTKKGRIATGSAELILKLRKRYRLALASSASANTVKLFLKKSGYADAFEFTLDGSSVKKAKPDPEIYQIAVNRLELNFEECVVVEDSTNGVEAAKNAKIPVIAITEQRERFAHLKPDMIVSELTDIETFLL